MLLKDIINSLLGAHFGAQLKLEKNNKSKFQEQIEALSRINIDLR
jgi:hypothetical protein